MNSDMTSYCFQHFENAYNIGWHENGDKVGKTKGQLDSAFLEKLKVYCEHPLNKDLNGKHRTVEINGEKYVKGFGEIRILDVKRQIRYAAPNIIIDDMIEGRYIPPQAFVEAVLEGPDFASEMYQAFYNSYSQSNYWGEPPESVEDIEKAVTLLEEDFRAFKAYIKEEGHINLVTLKGSLLNHALETGKDEVANWLIENGIPLDRFDGLELLTAIRKNNTTIGKRLIDKRIVADGREMKDNPLVSAIRYGNYALVEALLKNYPSLMVTYSNEYVRNCTMLDIAQRTKNEQIIRLVRQYM